MDFAKFVSMLATKALHFARIDKLRDKYEGALTKQSLDEYRRFVDQQPAQEQPRLLNALDIFKDFRNSMYVNCWHINKGESAAMWDLYLKSNEGVAVRTTFKRVEDALRQCPYSVDASRVRYVDYETAFIPLGGPVSIYLPVVHKRLSYEHEHELRLFCWGHNRRLDELQRQGMLIAGTTIELHPLPDHPGVALPVDLDALIEAVYVAPSSPGWFYELVKSVLSTFGVNKPVHQSDLDRDPVL